MATTEIKIAYIGGGSREWARTPMFGLALCPDLGGQMALYDADMDAARVNEQLGNWLQTQPGVVSRWKYLTVSTLSDVLRGADFVVLSIQPGPLEIMADEIAVAEEYGLFFPVGDTTGAPGLVRGLRAATIYAEFAEAIHTICPRAWAIHCTNPMAVCTRTLTKVAPSLKVFGCCHEVFATQRLLAELVSRYWGVSPVPSRTDIRIKVFGLNPFTWIDRCEYRGRDVMELVKQHIAQPGTLRIFSRAEVESWNDRFRSSDQVKFVLFQRYGLLAADGDRQLVEFLRGFIRSIDTLFQWGIIRTPVSWRIESWRTAAQKTHDLMSGRTPFRLQASGEEGVGQIRALAGLEEPITNVNLPNQGQVSNLPADTVVETNAHFGRDEIRPVSSGRLPPGLAPIIARHNADQELIAEAALTRNPDLAFQAVYGDPTNPLTPDEAWKMFRRMLSLNRDFLPGWKIADGPA
jgi:alpha-galactosidase/6-phospho-beta-glucosidase family protein